MILVGLPVLLLFVISLTGYLGSEVIKCAYSKRRADSPLESYLYTAAVSGFCALSLVLLSGFTFPASLFSVGLGLLFGIAVMGHILASSLAIRVGPWSYTTVLVSLAIVFPAFSGALFWGESLSWLDFVGLGFMIVCLILSVQKKSDDKKGSLKWLLLCVLAMICMAGVGLLQKTHQTTEDHKGEVTVFLLTAFAFSFLCSLVLYLIGRAKTKGRETTPDAPKGKGIEVILLLIGAGLSTALNHSINLYLSGALDSVVFFPVMCGCELIGVTLISLLLFKERLTLKQWLGLAAGGVAVLLLCI